MVVVYFRKKKFPLYCTNENDESSQDSVYRSLGREQCCQLHTSFTSYEGTSKSFRTLFFKKSLFTLQTREQHYFSI